MSGFLQSPSFGRLALTLCALCEHVQVMSFGNRMLDNEDWQSGAKDLFDGMGKVALRFTGTGYLVIYVLSLVFSLSFLCLYLGLTVKVHQWNRTPGAFSLVFLFIDHVIFGLGFVPMLAAFAETQLCNGNGNLTSYTSQACWNDAQTTMLTLGFIGASAVVIISATVCPLLREERGGLERKWKDEEYFPALFRLLTAGIIYIAAGVHKPYLGIIGCGALILYLGWCQAYRDNHLAAVKMGVLCGQLWVFVSAQVAASSSSTKGSQMLAGWIPAIILGYVIQWCIWIFRRKNAPSVSDRKQAN